MNQNGNQVNSGGKDTITAPSFSSTQADILYNIKHPVPAGSLAISPDESLVALAGGMTNFKSGEAAVTLWDINSGEQLTQLTGLTGTIRWLAFSHDGKRIAATNQMGGYAIWDWQTGKIEKRYDDQELGKWQIFWDESGTVHHQRKLRRSKHKIPYGEQQLQILRSEAQITDLKTGEIKKLVYKELSVPDRFLRGQWLPDGRAVCLLGAKSVCLWQPAHSASDAPHQDQYQLFPFPKDYTFRLMSQWQFMPKANLLVGVNGESSSPIVLELTSPPQSTSIQTTEESSNPVQQTTENKIKIPLSREWVWGREDWGYHGVHNFNGELFWFTHHENRHAGGGCAATQSYQDFLANGPLQNPPAEIVAEIHDVIKQIMG